LNKPFNLAIEKGEIHKRVLDITIAKSN
jgi:hypothetical protein